MEDTTNALLTVYAILNAVLALFIKGRLDRRRLPIAAAARTTTSTTDADSGRSRPLLRSLPPPTHGPLPYPVAIAVIGNLAAVVAYLLGHALASTVYGHPLLAPVVAAPCLLLLSPGLLRWSRLLDSRNRYVPAVLGLVLTWAGHAGHEIAGLLSTARHCTLLMPPAA